jgi:GNAT superfamily N-acetyltransferase
LIDLLHATSHEDIRIARVLLREYQRAVGGGLCFQSFEAELASLPGDYAPPSGRLFLAKIDRDTAGCVALRRLSDSSCEMKRLFVRDEFKGKGVGRKLASAIIEEARSQGYTAIRLETLATMTPAQALYGSLGFKPIPAEALNPSPALNFELGL